MRREDVLPASNRDRNAISASATGHPIGRRTLTIWPTVSGIWRAAEMSLSPAEHSLGDFKARHRVGFPEAGHDISWQHIRAIGHVTGKVIGPPRHRAMQWPCMQLVDWMRVCVRGMNWPDSTGCLKRPGYVVHDRYLCLLQRVRKSSRPTGIDQPEPSATKNLDNPA